jgi:two-component system chemotaxis response regulator CheY
MNGYDQIWKQTSFVVVDDNAQFRRLIFSFLRKFGADEVFEAGDAIQAYRIACDKRIDFALIDVAMEPMDGISLARLLRTEKEVLNPDLTMALITGHATADVIKAARDLGIKDILTKPLSGKQLHDRVLRLIPRSEA